MKARYVFSLLAAGMLLLFAACGTSGQGTSSGEDPDRITFDQMMEAAEQYDTAHAVIQNLRPLWLRKRGRVSIANPSEIVVYLDGSRYGSPNTLHNIQASDVASMEFLSPAEATNRYGTGHAHGAILVNTKDNVDP